MGTHDINPMTIWFLAFLAAGLLAGVVSGYFRARKIQPNGFKWKLFFREIFWASINLTFSGAVIGGAVGYLTTHGFIRFNESPAAWWVIALEFAVSFVAFDTYFYWLHRLMHVEPFYKWVHKIHHGSPSPNPLTTFSESPIESMVNGGFMPLFMLAATLLAPIHAQTMALIIPVNVLMGLYVHMGFEFLPRWWNKSWVTKWFITTTFHDQHHRYFKGNYGGYTTVWDRLCGTMRSHYEADFEQVASRPVTPLWEQAGKAGEAQSARS